FIYVTYLYGEKVSPYFTEKKRKEMDENDEKFYILGYICSILCQMDPKERIIYEIAYNEIVMNELYTKKIRIGDIVPILLYDVNKCLKNIVDKGRDELIRELLDSKIKGDTFDELYKNIINIYESCDEYFELRKKSIEERVDYIL